MQLPVRLGKYELEEFLGGGMSHVYRARDTLIGRTVAVKILTEAGCQDPEAKTRFLAEARMAGNISHENIISIYDFGEDEGHRPFMVMEFLRGKDLGHAIKDGTAGGMTSRLRIALQVARALRYIHTQKIIHRDIKPENIHLNPDGTAKLIDFGIAKTEGLAMTRAGYVLGTPSYMAPEQVYGAPVDRRTDVYGFGALVYELITSEKLFRGDTVERIFYAILNEAPDLKPFREAGTPERIVDLIRRCLAKRPSDRPDGFETVCESLEHALESTDEPIVTAQPASILPTASLRRSRWLSFGVAAFIGAIGSAAAVFLLTRSRHAPGIPVSFEPSSTLGVFVFGLVLCTWLLWYIGQLAVHRHRVGTGEKPVASKRSPTLPPASPSSRPSEQATPLVSRSSLSPPVPPAEGLSEYTRRIPSSPPASVQSVPQLPVGTHPQTTPLGRIESPRTPGASVPQSAPAPALEGDFERLFDRSPEPASPRASTVPALPNAPGEFTRMFQTGTVTPNPAEPPTVPPPFNAPPKPMPDAAPESTQIFSVPQQGTAARPALPDAPLTDVTLTITSCADNARVGGSLELRQCPFVIGRNGPLSFDSAISREHAELQYSDGGFFLRDLGSQNGTFLDGRRLEPDEPQPLLFGSRILLGSNTQLTFGFNESTDLPLLTDVLIAGKYRLGDRLSESTKSVWYVARQVELDQPVAVSILTPKLLRYPEYREQFQRQARIASGLRHYSVSRVLDFGETEIGPDLPRTLYLCMDYLAGGNLKGRLEGDQKIEVGRAVSWIEKLTAALDYIHRMNVVHGGIKPSAIVFDAADNPSLTDFALAVTLGHQSNRKLIGSPPFLAPEQWEGRDLLTATDQYSLAAVFYLVVTGSHPYDRQDHPVERKRNFTHPPMAAHLRAAENGWPALPAALSAVFQRAMALQPEKRYDTAGEFAQAFRAALLPQALEPVTRPIVFLSYHRESSLAWALLLKSGLEKDHNCDVFVDVANHDEPGDLPEYLAEQIQRCNVFVCLLSAGTLASEWVQTELECAYRGGKCLIPVFQEDYRRPPDLSAEPVHVQKLVRANGAKLLDRQGDYIEAAIQKLHGLIRQSLE